MMSLVSSFIFPFKGIWSGLNKKTISSSFFVLNYGKLVLNSGSLPNTAYLSGLQFPKLQKGRIIMPVAELSIKKSKIMEEHT